MRTRTARVFAATVTVCALATACVAPPANITQPSSPPKSAKPAPPATAPPTTAPPSNTFRQAKVAHRIGSCDIFGVDHYMNATGIDRLPVHRDSARWITHLGAGSTRLHSPSPDVWQGSRGGIPINVVNSSRTGFKSVLLNPHYSGHNYTDGYPIPAAPRLEGHPGAAWDRHLLIVDEADCSAYELIQYDPLLGALGAHTALAGARYPLSGTAMPTSTTNAVATPMVGQAAMIADVNAGAIRYPLSWCTDIASPRHTWPARASDGPSTSPSAPPQGAWLRLRADVDRGRFTGQARVIVDALARHGMVLTDTCGHRFSIGGENSDQWNRDAMRQLATLTVANFEAVDVTPMMVSPNTWQIR